MVTNYSKSTTSTTRGLSTAGYNFKRKDNTRERQTQERQGQKGHGCVTPVATRSLGAKSPSTDVPR